MTAVTLAVAATAADINLSIQVSQNVTVVQWLALPPNSTKVVGLIPGLVLSVWSLSQEEAGIENE